MNTVAQDDADGIARTIVGALKLKPGERVLIRFDPSYMNELVQPLRKGIREAGAIDVAAVEYVENVTSLQSLPATEAAKRQQTDAHVKAFEQLLESSDVYLWLATSPSRDLYDAETHALRKWLLKGGTRRQIHFHWGSGSMNADGLPDKHSEQLDRIYRDALSIDYDALSSSQNRAISILRTGTVRVRTPAGTDLSFQAGSRPFSKQDGNASPERALAAKVLIDREIEMPAGVLRVAPVEETVQGTMVIPKARFGEVTIRNLRLNFVNGKITEMQAENDVDHVRNEFSKSGDVALRFREFGLGFNPKLKSPAGSSVIPYYGYGAGVVRLSLGDNSELGGMVKGAFTRWFFFPDATVDVDGRTLVENGRLL